MIRECENPCAPWTNAKIRLQSWMQELFFKAADVTMSEPASNVEERRRNDVYRALSCFS
jgi:hypothetical protein